jgi:hypothetical protein
VAALISTGSWDPRPGSDADWEEFEESLGAALRRDGTRGLIEVFKEEDGETYEREFPPWAEEVTLRADPEALLAAQARELMTDGVPTLEGFPVPVLLIAGELEDPTDKAASTAAMVASGQRLRLPGLAHGGACAASALASSIAGSTER